MSLLFRFINSAALKCILQNMVTTNGTSLTFMMSASKVTFRWCFSIPVGRSSVVITNQLVFFLVVLPWSHPKFIPKMSSAWIMLTFMIRKFGMMFLSTYLIKSKVLGRSIMSCWERAHTASEYCLMVYLDLFLTTVLRETWFLSSEKNCPILESLNIQVVLSTLCTRKPWFRSSCVVHVMAIELWHSILLAFLVLAHKLDIQRHASK